jgi:YD repeat-containing protein
MGAELFVLSSTKGPVVSSPQPSLDWINLHQANRLAEKLYPDSTSVNYTYDLDSRLTQVTDPTGAYTFTFDNMGRLTAATSSYSFLAGHNFTSSYSYDAASSRTGFTAPDVRQVLDHLYGGEGL